MKKLNPKWITKTQTERLYQLPVPIIGLTGGIATGKSTVAGLLRQRGYALIDADRLVKNIYATQDALTFIQQEFPTAILNQQIDFKTLRALVFNDPFIQEKVEQFIYARMQGEFLKAYLSLGNPEFVIYDVPLLFEKKLDEKVDASFCVYCPRDMQKARLIARDHITPHLAETILARQLDIEEKKSRSNLVLLNDKGPEELEASLQKILSELH